MCPPRRTESSSGLPAANSAQCARCHTPRMPPAPIRKLSPLADRARTDGVHIYHLNIGQPDLAAPQSLMEGIRHYEGTLLPYAPSAGIDETVTAWQAYYEQVGLHFDHDQLLV